MKRIIVAAFMLLSAIAVSAQKQTDNGPLVIKAQGSFMAGGTVVKADGVYDTNDQTNPQGQTLHGDHAYVSYQVPVNARPYPMVFLHGAACTFGMAQKFVACINRHGGKARLVVLPDIGIKGNRHFLFAEKNNVELADLLEKWMEENLETEH